MKQLHILIPLLVLLSSGCEKISVEPYIMPSFGNIYATMTEPYTYKFSTSVFSDKINECGFYCSESASMLNAKKYPSNLSGNSFSSVITLIGEGKKYYVCAYVSNGRTEICSEIKDITVSGNSSWADSLLPSANAYIIPFPGRYSFTAVKGNSMTSVGDAASAEVLWESYGTSKTITKGSLIKSVSLTGTMLKTVIFETNPVYQKGNAVIAVKDASGTVLWSWHIWLTDEPNRHTYNNNAGIMMDRNLGATSAIPGDVGALGLLYQWGRKDPFLGSSSINSTAEAKSTITWPSAVTSSSSTGNLSYANAHPTTFITYNSDNSDWYYTGGSSTEIARWQSSKTIYDPCPAGWRVPDGGKLGVWSKAFSTSSDWNSEYNWDSANNGMDLSRTDRKLGQSGPIWYPAPGYRNSSNGRLSGVGSNGFYWSVSPYDLYAYGLNFYINSNDVIIFPAGYYNMAGGLSIRCIKQ